MDFPSSFCLFSPSNFSNVHCICLKGSVSPWTVQYAEHLKFSWRLPISHPSKFNQIYSIQVTKTKTSLSWPLPCTPYEQADYSPRRAVTFHSRRPDCNDNVTASKTVDSHPIESSLHLRLFPNGQPSLTISQDSLTGVTGVVVPSTYLAMHMYEIKDSNFRLSQRLQTRFQRDVAFISVAPQHSLLRGCET
ncbi:hypothetical protein BDR22DRAFT_603779 [Usnea florida]